MRWPFILSCASLAFGQAGGTVPKPNAEDYEAHAQAGTAAIGAEYTVHSFSGQGQTYIAPGYLVVEVALYPPRGQAIHVDEGAFALRVNGRKQALMPEPPAMVAASLKHSDWQTGPRLEGSIGAGPADVIFGRPSPTQVPGGRQPLPTPPRAPDADPPGGIQPEPRVKAEDLAVQAALPRGDWKAPVSGFLYFPYKGKAASVKSLELLYDDVVMKLR